MDALTPLDGGGTPRILVVEDDWAIRELMRTVLQDMGLTVDLASNGKQALELAGESRPTLVILDLGLPEMYGKMVGQHLKRKLGTVPIIVVSALGSSTVAQDAWEMGAFAYMTKPFEIDTLATFVRRGLTLGR